MRPSRSATRAADLCAAKVDRFYLQPAGPPTMACVSLTWSPRMSETLVPILTLLALCPPRAIPGTVCTRARLGRGPPRVLAIEPHPRGWPAPGPRVYRATEDARPRKPSQPAQATALSSPGALGSGAPVHRSQWVHSLDDAPFTH